MSNNAEQPTNSDRFLGRIAELAAMIAPACLDDSNARYSKYIADAIRWGPYDERALLWRQLKQGAEQTAARKNPTIESLAFRALTKVVFTWPVDLTRSENLDLIESRLSDLDDLVLILTSDRTSAPKLSSRGTITGRLSELSQNLKEFQAALPNKDQLCAPVAWLARWVHYVACDTTTVIEGNASGNTIGILLDDLFNTSTVPPQIFEVNDIALIIRDVRQQVEKWLMDDFKIEVICPLPFVDLVNGNLHAPKFEPVENVPERTIVRVVRVGWKVGTRIERTADVVAVASQPQSSKQEGGALEEGQRARKPY